MMPRPDVTGDRLLTLVDDFAGVRVAVLGDLLVDEFIYGQISRVSREAPVLILEYDSTDIVPGGAGTQQAVLVFAFSGTAAASTVLGFSVGMQLVTTAVNVILGFGAIAGPAFETT